MRIVLGTEVKKPVPIIFIKAKCYIRRFRFSMTHILSPNTLHQSNFFPEETLLLEVIYSPTVSHLIFFFN